MPAIRTATAADLPAIGRTLAAAFDDDPVWTFLAPNRDRWKRRAPGFFASDARTRLAHGMVYVDEKRTGAALWAPPGKWRTAPGALAREMPASLALLGLGTARALRLLSRMEKVHPKEPHHYLSLLGTEPAHQGKGIGSALVAHVTERSDEEGLPSYLESSKESNLAFYARHGFEVTERLDIPDGPSLWPMWREPRS